MDALAADQLDQRLPRQVGVIGHDRVGRRNQQAFLMGPRLETRHPRRDFGKHPFHHGVVAGIDGADVAHHQPEAAAGNRAHHLFAVKTADLALAPDALSALGAGLDQAVMLARIAPDQFSKRVAREQRRFVQLVGKLDRLMSPQRRMRRIPIGKHGPECHVHALLRCSLLGPRPFRNAVSRSSAVLMRDGGAISPHNLARRAQGKAKACNGTQPSRSKANATELLSLQSFRFRETIQSAPAKSYFRCMTLPSTTRALILGAGPQMQCGVGQFTLRLAETLEKLEPGSTAALTLSQTQGSLVEIWRGVGSASNIVCNFPIVAWKRVIPSPLLALSFARLRGRRVILVQHEWRSLHWLRRITYLPAVLLANRIVMFSPLVRKELADDPLVGWTARKCALAPLPPNVEAPAGVADSKLRQ